MSAFFMLGTIIEPTAAVPSAAFKGVYAQTEVANDQDSLLFI